MAEVVGASCATILKEALEETVRCGVPREAAEAFMFGHLKIMLAIVFKSTNPFSDACYRAIDYGTEKIFKENWRDVFKPEAVQEVLDRMLHPN